MKVNLTFGGLILEFKLSLSVVESGKDGTEDIAESENGVEKFRLGSTMYLHSPDAPRNKEGRQFLLDRTLKNWASLLDLEIGSGYSNFALESTAEQTYVDALFNEMRFSEQQNFITGTTFFLPPGATVLHGPAKSGKSFLIARILGDPFSSTSAGTLQSLDGKVEVLRAFEHEVLGCSFSEAQVLVQCAHLLFASSAPIVVIDSIRIWAFAGGKAAGARGLNQTLISGLTTLNALACIAGKSLILVLNTQGGGQELDLMMRDILPGAVPTVLTANGSNYTLSSRVCADQVWVLGAGESARFALEANATDATPDFDIPFSTTHMPYERMILNGGR